jgi:hypothetical protein
MPPEMCLFDGDCPLHHECPCNPKAINSSCVPVRESSQAYTEIEYKVDMAERNCSKYETVITRNLSLSCMRDLTWALYNVSEGFDVSLDHDCEESLADYLCCYTCHVPLLDSLDVRTYTVDCSSHSINWHPELCCGNECGSMLHCDSFFSD